MGFSHLLWDPVAQRLFCPCRPANAGQSGVRRRTIRRASADRPSCVELRCFCLCRALSLSSVVRRTVRRPLTDRPACGEPRRLVCAALGLCRPSLFGRPSVVFWRTVRRVSARDFFSWSALGLCRPACTAETRFASLRMGAFAWAFVGLFVAVS